MQATATSKNVRLSFCNKMLLITFGFFLTTGLFAQQYVNGNLSTGATAKNGTAAPTGYTWSELQNDAGNTSFSNTNLGFGASIANNSTIADDFTVPTGQTWGLTKITVYAYSTNYAGTTSPFTDLRLQIHRSSPLAGATTIAFGDLTTNRLSNTSDALMYRIGNTAVPTAGTTNTNRRIWKMEATVSVSLTAGTYWVEWQSNPGTLTSNFTPASTIVGARTQPGYNAIQKTGAAPGTWAALADAGNPAGGTAVAVDIPFIVDYTTAGGTVPSCASGLSPANGATGIAPNGGLSWTSVAGATSYDVYLGTTATPTLVTNVTTTSYTFSPALNLSTQYYYKIVPKNTTGAATGCTTLSFITAAASCASPVITSTSGDTAFCGTGSATLRITNGTLNGATQWVWYSGSCGGTSIGTGTSVTVTPTTTTTYYVRGEGGCISAGTGTCTSITVTKVASIGAPTINPVSPICLNSVQALTINAVATSTASTTISSGPISIAIPDNTANGVSSNLTVPALPAGAVIVGIDVKLNMTHTYIGDMIFNLKAPNGAILALDKYLTGTGAAGADFLNTIISSTGTTALSAGSAPFTASFMADALNTAITGVVVQNPAGFVSNAANFAALYSIPNGTWTLAMADGGPADLGTLTNWSITINYTTSTPAYPAIWSPSSTLFTDAAATIPYNGTTPLYQVYAKPSVTTTYTAQSVSGGCTSATTTATVVVNNPVAITVQPVNTTICEMATAAFVVTATGTTPSYQWLVNNGSGTYVAIADNANYAGSTTRTLSVKEVPYSWNGYKYRCLVTSTTPCTQFDTTIAATLTVNPTPVVSLVVAPYTRLLPGLSTTLTVTSIPAAVSYSWVRNNVAIANATTKDVIANIDVLGIYKATIVDVNGCTNSSAEFEITDSVSSNLFIFPNPNAGQFQVRYYSVKGNTLPRTMMVFDSKGALVMNKTFTVAKPYDKMDVDFSAISRGVYFINLLDVSGKRLASGKVVIR